MDADTRLLDAIITLSEREFSNHGSDPDRAGALRALLKESLPFLKRLRDFSCKEVAHG